MSNYIITSTGRLRVGSVSPAMRSPARVRILQNVPYSSPTRRIQQRSLHGDKRVVLSAEEFYGFEHRPRGQITPHMVDHNYAMPPEQSNIEIIVID